MNLLLDTHVFLWFVTGDPRIRPAHLQAIRSPANSLFLSAVSLWECLVKYHLKKIELPASPEIVLPSLRSQHGIASLPLDEVAVSRLAALPLIHKDPFDRMLVCQALQNNFTVITVDAIFSQYSVRLLPAN